LLKSVHSKNIALVTLSATNFHVIPVVECNPISSVDNNFQFSFISVVIKRTLFEILPCERKICGKMICIDRFHNEPRN
jgi:hypothetical protein